MGREWVCFPGGQFHNVSRESIEQTFPPPKSLAENFYHKEITCAFLSDGKLTVCVFLLLQTHLSGTDNKKQKEGVTPELMDWDELG